MRSSGNIKLTGKGSRTFFLFFLADNSPAIQIEGLFWSIVVGRGRGWRPWKKSSKSSTFLPANPLTLRPGKLFCDSGSDLTSSGESLLLRVFQKPSQSFSGKTLRIPRKLAEITYCVHPLSRRGVTQHVAEIPWNKKKLRKFTLVRPQTSFFRTLPKNFVRPPDLRSRDGEGEQTHVQTRIKSGISTQNLKPNQRIVQPLPLTPRFALFSNPTSPATTSSFHWSLTVCFQICQYFLGKRLVN